MPLSRPSMMQSWKATHQTGTVFSVAHDLEPEGALITKEGAPKTSVTHAGGLARNAGSRLRCGASKTVRLEGGERCMSPCPGCPGSATPS